MLFAIPGRRLGGRYERTERAETARGTNYNIIEKKQLKRSNFMLQYLSYFLQIS